MGPYKNPQGPLGCPHVNLTEPKVHVRYLATLWLKNTEITHRFMPTSMQLPYLLTFESPYMAHKPVSRMGADREPAWPHTIVYKPSMVQKSKEARKVVQAQYGAHTGLKILRARMAYHSINHRFSSAFYPYGACDLLGSFMWPRHLGDFVRTSHSHRLVWHPNPHGHETTRRSHMT